MMEMKERKEPVFKKDWVDGECIDGVLFSIDAVTMTDKQTSQKRRATRFVFLDGELIDGKFYPTGERTCFLGTHQVNQNLLITDVGHYVSVRYEGRDQSVTRNGNAMRKFKIFVSEGKPLVGGVAIAIGQQPQAGDETEITDQDIPF